MTLDDKLNKEQKSSILHIEGPLRIVAGPGSGKTKVLTNKIAYLIDNIGYNPRKILAVTFTNKAANVMKSRVASLIGVRAEEVLISTFHSLAVRILREEIKLLGIPSNFKILDTIDQKQILKSIFNKLDISTRVLTFSRAINYIEEIKYNQRDTEDFKKTLFTDIDKTLFQIYEKYEEERIDKKYLDFNDLLISVKKIFDENTDVKEKWAKRFDYILVDEFQDTSEIQYEIIKSMAMGHQNITIVGDPDQAIYSWRGANPEIFMDFDKDFAGTTTIKMVQNYRSTKRIVHVANSLIQNNLNRVEKELFTENAEGEEIVYYHGLNANFEARWIVNQIKTLRKNKSQLKDIAVLYRLNSLSQNIEKIFIEEGIEYKIFGGIKFFQRAEIKDTLAFLSLLSNLNDDSSLERIINVPSRKIGETTQLKLFDKSLRPKGQSLISYVKNNIDSIEYLTKSQKEELMVLVNEIIRHHLGLKQHGITLVLRKFLEKINYINFIKNSDSEDRIQNVEQFLDGLAEYEAKHRLSTISNHEKIADYLQEIALFYSQDEISEIVDYVSLMTVHTAKGLEYSNIFVMGLSDGIFPTHQAISSIDENLLEEERRLAYVAITRAQERVFLSDSKGFLNDKGDEKIPSRFLQEMDIEQIFKTATQNIQIENLEKGRSKRIKFVIGDKIKHIKFGFGQVVAVYDDLIDVAFGDPYGVKSLLKTHNSIEREDE